MIIYLSGRITGLNQNYCKLLFERAKRNIQRCHGGIVINPLDIRPLFGIKSYWFYMAADIWQLLHCTHIFMLPNWMESRGAKIERKIAKIFGIKEL